MSTTTTNLGLLKPELTDAADLTSYNSNWDVLDEKIGKINIKTYTSLDQIGLTEGSETIESIASKLPTYSILSYVVGSNSNLAQYPNSNYGLLVVNKTVPSRIVFTFTNSQGTQHEGHFAITSNGNTWTGWQQIATTIVYTAEVVSGGAIGDDGYYYRNVAIDGIRSTDTPIVDILTGDDNDANVQYAECLSKIVRVQSAGGKLVLYYKEKPQYNFPIQVKVVR